MKRHYCVELFIGEDPVALFETESITKACNFLQTIDYSRLKVRFLRLFPFKEFNLQEVLEVINDEI